MHRLEGFLPPNTAYQRAQVIAAQRTSALGKCLIHEPQLLVCDEPTSALDAQTGHTIMELLRGVALEAGRAVVVVTHDNRVYEFGDRIARMEDGKVIDIHQQTPHASFAAGSPGATPTARLAS